MSAASTACFSARSTAAGRSWSIILVDKQPAELCAVAVKYIEIHLCLDAVHAASFAVLPEGPGPVNARSFLLQIMRHPKWVRIEIIPQVLFVEVYVGIDDRLDMI